MEVDDDAEPFEPRPSLWAEICRLCPPSETEEIRRIVGVSMLEQNDDLHREVRALLDIWRDLRREATSQGRVSSAGEPKRLPEPPMVRERLRSEIMFFVGNLRERAIEMGANPDALIAPTGQEKNVLEYVMLSSSHEGLRRPTTASRPQTPLRDVSTPGSAASRAQSRASMGSAKEARGPADEIVKVRRKISVHSIDEIAERLRDALARERELLLGDVAFLHDSLERARDDKDAAVDYARRMSGVEEPTIQQLREYGTRLEKEYLSRSKANLGPSPQSSPSKGGVPAVPSPMGSRASTKRPVSTPSPASSAATKRRAADGSDGEQATAQHPASQPQQPPLPQPPGPPPGAARSSNALRAKRAFALGAPLKQNGVANGRSPGVARHASASDGASDSDGEVHVVRTAGGAAGARTGTRVGRPPLPPKRSDSAMSVSTVVLDDELPATVVGAGALDSESDFQLSSNDEEFFMDEDPPRRPPPPFARTPVAQDDMKTGDAAGGNKGMRSRPSSAQRLRAAVMQYRAES